MGLHCSHDAFCGSYRSFDRLRQFVRAAAAMAETPLFALPNTRSAELSKPKTMDFADTLNELTQHLDGTFWTLKGFVAFPELDGFQQQDTGMKTLPIEFVKQTGNDDYGFSGEIYFPTSYTNGDGGRLHLHITFTA